MSNTPNALALAKQAEKYGLHELAAELRRLRLIEISYLTRQKREAMHDSVLACVFCVEGAEISSDLTVLKSPEGPFAVAYSFEMSAGEDRYKVKINVNEIAKNAGAA
jgi:hypothetical protein